MAKIMVFGRGAGGYHRIGGRASKVSHADRSVYWAPDGFSFAFRVHGFCPFSLSFLSPHIPYKTCPNCDFFTQTQVDLAFLITFFKNFASSVDHMGERRCC